MLLAQIEIEAKSLEALTAHLANINPMHYDLTHPSPFYTYKIKHLLTTIALGLMPATPWQGIYDANGGLLVVKQDGEILCYHFYERNRFENYLFRNAYLERASSTRHNYARLERHDNKLLFKLNLQIRLR